ncbi:hypothetical protein PSY52_22975, partial [Shigella flexneri]|nr:hypothetical protein [Shigella flexneri]
ARLWIRLRKHIDHFFAGCFAAGIDTLWHCSSFTSPWGTQQGEVKLEQCHSVSMPASITS